jgi:outer membrane protein assembly factor BamB
MVRHVQLQLRDDQLVATRQWQATIDDVFRLYGTPVLHGDRIYALGDGSHLYVLDAQTGKTLEKARVPAFGHGQYASPLVVADHLLLVSSEKGALSVPLDNISHFGTPLQNLKSSSTPAWLNGRWYFRTYDALLAL